MKISTDKAVDILIEVTPYISDIVNDKDIKAVIEKYKSNPTDTLSYMSELLPTFLKKHREPIYIILSELNGVTLEAIKKQSIFKTITQIKELAKDKEIMSFFTLFGKQA